MIVAEAVRGEGLPSLILRRDLGERPDVRQVRLDRLEERLRTRDLLTVGQHAHRKGLGGVFGRKGAIGQREANRFTRLPGHRHRVGLHGDCAAHRVLTVLVVGPREVNLGVLLLKGQPQALASLVVCHQPVPVVRIEPVIEAPADRDLPNDARFAGTDDARILRVQVRRQAPGMPAYPERMRLLAHVGLLDNDDDFRAPIHEPHLPLDAIGSDRTPDENPFVAPAFRELRLIALCAKEPIRPVRRGYSGVINPSEPGPGCAVLLQSDLPGHVIVARLLVEELRNAAPDLRHDHEPDVLVLKHHAVQTINLLPFRLSRRRHARGRQCTKHSRGKSKTPSHSVAPISLHFVPNPARFTIVPPRRHSARGLP